MLVDGTEINSQTRKLRFKMGGKTFNHTVFLVQSTSTDLGCGLQPVQSCKKRKKRQRVSELSCHAVTHSQPTTCVSFPSSVHCVSLIFY